MSRRATPAPMPGSALLKTMGQREIRDNMRTHVSFHIRCPLEKRVPNGSTATTSIPCGEVWSVSVNYSEL